MNQTINRGLGAIAQPRSGNLGITAMKIAIAVIFLWIGALKFVPYEADSITPFVANSPAMSFFYAHPEDYKLHMTHEGELKPVERAWQLRNDTYGFSTRLGMVELLIGGLVMAGLVSRRAGFLGAALALATTFVTLSFLVTTPEAWVPALGDAQHGFPFLSGAGRLVLKDVAIMAGAWLILVDTARKLLPAPATGITGPQDRSAAR
ncbi:reactive chlorine resistance membrane protein RclC [Novosphingobium sp. BL-8H]|uniref:reactive chlorine resistance membrane protein RclC n=1 Tax=Novosphingobium sp. BL-8H TaxID=3127640 RepID=UPI003757C313